MVRWFAALAAFAFVHLFSGSLAAIDSPPDDGKLKIVVFGAHPDDAEYKAGGCGAKWAKLGHHVLLCSVTNGDIGHWQMAGGPLAARRTAEAAACSKVRWAGFSTILVSVARTYSANAPPPPP